MKLNSPQSLKTAEEVFRSYHGSWTAAREAGRCDADGVLVIPMRLNGRADSDALPAAAQRNGRTSG